MREIKYIVIHHSVTPRDLDLEKSLNSFNNSHKVRLTDKFNQPLSGTKWDHIAYHYVIGGSGTIASTRNHDIVGYHAGNLKVNKESLGICLNGHFDKEKPSEKQLDTLSHLIRVLKEEYPKAKVIGHRDVAGVKKSCPGKNFTDNMIQRFNSLGSEIENKSDNIISEIELLQDGIGFTKQSKADCVPYSIMMGAIIRMCLKKPELIDKLKVDETFPKRFREAIGRPKGALNLGGAIEKLKKNDTTLEIYCGDYTLALKPNGGLVKLNNNQEAYEKYIKMGRPIVVSMTYHFFDKYGINAKQYESPHMPYKHNGLLVGIYPNKRHIQKIDRGKGKIQQRITKGLALWLDTTNKTSYSEDLPMGVKGMPTQFMSYKGNLVEDGIWEAFSVNPTLID